MFKGYSYLLAGGCSGNPLRDPISVLACPLLAASPPVDCAAVRAFGQVQLVPSRHTPANFCAGAVELGWELGRIRIIPPPLQLLETDTQRTGEQSRNLNHWVVGYPTPSALRASTTPHKVGALLASDTDSE